MSELKMYLSARDIAEYLGVCESTARKKMLDMNPLDLREPGSSKALLRVRREDFEDWLLGRCKPRMERIYVGDRRRKRRVS